MYVDNTTLVLLAPSYPGSFTATVSHAVSLAPAVIVSFATIFSSVYHYQYVTESFSLSSSSSEAAAVSDIEVAYNRQAGRSQ